MTGGDGFRALPVVLAAHARDVDAVACGVESARSAAAQLHLGRSAYGLLCQFIPALLDPVQDLGIGALGDAMDALTSTADRVRASAGGYDGSDARAVHRFGGSEHR